MTKHKMNETLFDVAEWRLRGEAEKQAFVPQGATDPAAAAPPPGGAPPGGDPMAAMAMGGMAPPMDPMAAAGAPAMAGAAAAPPAGAAPGQPGAGGKAKIDPAFIYMELSRVRKLLTHFMQHAGVDMPNDILDDNTVAMVAQGMQPQSAAIGAGGQAEQGMGGDPMGGGMPGIGGSPPINPIEPAGGAEKPAHDVMSMFRGPTEVNGRTDVAGLGERIDAISAMSRSLNGA